MSNTPAVPTEDAEFLEIVTDIAISTYSQNGDLPILCALDAPMGLIIAPAEKITCDEDKIHYVNTLRFLSIRHESRRSAIAMEIWTIAAGDDADRAELDAIYARGGSMSEHSKASEALIILLESDQGGTQRTYPVIRDGITTTLGEPKDDYTPAEQLGGDGIFVGFHIPSGMRDDPGIQAFASAMNAVLDGEYQRVPLATPPKGN